MIPVAPRVVTHSNDNLYVVLLLVSFLLVSYALWRFPLRRRSTEKRAHRDQRKLRH